MPRLVILALTVFCTWLVASSSLAMSPDELGKACERNIVQIDGSMDGLVFEAHGERLRISHDPVLASETMRHCAIMLFTDGVVGGMYVPEEGEWVVSEWHVADEGVVMNGELGTHTEYMLWLLNEAFPDEKLLIMQNVPGSVDDEAVAEAIAAVHVEGYDTYVPQGGLIASGGTDFFLGGNRRAVHPTAKVGVHSWAEIDEDGKPVDGRSLPRGADIHQEYLELYRYIGIPEKFYWFTLDSAPADAMHYMSAGELLEFSVVNTKPDRLLRKYSN